MIKFFFLLYFEWLVRSYYPCLLVNECESLSNFYTFWHRKQSKTKITLGVMGKLSAGKVSFPEFHKARNSSQEARFGKGNKKRKSRPGRLHLGALKGDSFDTTALPSTVCSSASLRDDWKEEEETRQRVISLFYSFHCIPSERIKIVFFNQHSRTSLATSLDFPYSPLSSLFFKF